eukprot:492747-Rhodomonas_salina.4
MGAQSAQWHEEKQREERQGRIAGEAEAKRKETGTRVGVRCRRLAHPTAGGGGGGGGARGAERWRRGARGEQRRVVSRGHGAHARDHLLANAQRAVTRAWQRVGAREERGAACASLEGPGGAGERK